MASIARRISKIMTNKIHIHLTLTPQEAEWLISAMGVGGLDMETPWAPLLVRIERQILNNLHRLPSNKQEDSAGQDRLCPYCGGEIGDPYTWCPMKENH